MGCGGSKATASSVPDPLKQQVNGEIAKEQGPLTPITDKPQSDLTLQSGVPEGSDANVSLEINGGAVNENDISLSFNEGPLLDGANGQTNASALENGLGEITRISTADIATVTDVVNSLVSTVEAGEENSHDLKNTASNISILTTTSDTQPYVLTSALSSHSGRPKKNRHIAFSPEVEGDAVATSSEPNSPTSTIESANLLADEEPTGNPAAAAAESPKGHTLPHLPSELPITFAAVPPPLPPQVLPGFLEHRTSSFSDKPAGEKQPIKLSVKPTAKFAALSFYVPPTVGSVSQPRRGMFSFEDEDISGSSKNQVPFSPTSTAAPADVLSPASVSQRERDIDDSSSTVTSTITISVPQEKPRRTPFQRAVSQAASPSKAAHLLRLDSDGMEQLCSVCSEEKTLGLSCTHKNHFICEACFSPYVAQLCQDIHKLKIQNFAVSCPMAGCQSMPWNSYHVRKALSGKVLESYIDTLVNVCKDTEVKEFTRKYSMTDALSAAITDDPKLKNGSTADGGGSGMRPVQLPENEKQYYEATIQMLRDMLKKQGVAPIEYIPLPDLRKELNDILSKVHSEQPYDEGRLDHLWLCLEAHPDYLAEKEAERQAWLAEFKPYAEESLATMRGFITPDIFSTTESALVQEAHLPAGLAKRILNKKCLWLVRMTAKDIERLHEADLYGRFNPMGQGLDIIELAAIYACLPEKFTSDSTGKKEQWRQEFEKHVRSLDADRISGKLDRQKRRSAAYRDSLPAFTHRMSFHQLQIMMGIKE